MHIMLARQPIFHKTDTVAAYELLSRSCDSPQDSAPVAATTADQLLVDVCLGPGFAAATGGLPAFVAVSRELLVGGALDLVDPTRLVLQITAPPGPDPDLNLACVRMAGAGYRFAIAHDTLVPGLEPLLYLASYIKLDVRRYDAAALEQEVGVLRRFPAALLAEHVESRATHERCVALGFEYFEGLLFSRPETFESRDLSIEHVRAFRLMRKVRDLHTTDAALEEEFRGDPALSYKLLRMVNSAAHGGRGIRSIGHALRLLGRDALQRWLALMVLSTGRQRGVDAEIARATLLRARMCELLGDAGRRPLASGTLFILGLLSALETFLGMPAEAICENLQLAPELAAALTARRGPFGACLSLVEAYENGRWDELAEEAATVGVHPAQLTGLYFDALAWAAERAAGLEAAEDTPGRVEAGATR